jgi:acyl dehydratase
MTCKALVDALFDADVAAVGSYGAHFAGVAYPGETLKVGAWKEDSRLLANVVAPARENAVVLSGVELVIRGRRIVGRAGCTANRAVSGSSAVR